jgi:hypothetical protein
VILCLGELLDNWASYDWEFYFSAKPVGHRSTAEMGGVLPKRGFIYGELPADTDYYRSIFELCRYVDRLCVLSTRIENDHPLVQQAALSFYQTAANAVVQYGLPFLVPPHPGLVYRCFLSSSSLAVSEVCGLLVRLKSAFEWVIGLNQRRRGPEDAEGGGGGGGQGQPLPPHLMTSFRNGAEQAGLFNRYLLDFCRALWKETVFASLSSGAAEEEEEEEEEEPLTPEDCLGLDP